MMPTQPLIVVCGLSHKYEPEAWLYSAVSDAEAQQFCDRWNDQEQVMAEAFGGYPGYAFIAEPDRVESAADWLAEIQEEERFDEDH